MDGVVVVGVMTALIIAIDCGGGGDDDVIVDVAVAAAAAAVVTWPNISFIVTEMTTTAEGAHNIMAQNHHGKDERAVLDSLELPLSLLSAPFAEIIKNYGGYNR